MRGSISLDFILSLVIIMVGTASFFFLAYTQIENSAAASTQYKAEAMAMAAGSAINHFAAVQPGEGSSLELDFKSYSWDDDVGFALFIEDTDCIVSINSLKNILMVNITAYRMESLKPEEITARYPLVDVDSDAFDGVVSVPCDGKISIDHDLKVEGVEEVAPE